MDNDNNNIENSNAFSEENDFSVCNKDDDLHEESEIITIIKGIVGAMLGTIPSMLLWIVLGKVGVVAALCGFFMILGELYACDFMTKKSGQMNKETALLICAIVMLVTIYICERMIWAWELSDVLSRSGLTFSDCFLNFKSLLEELEIAADFEASLIQSYIFAILGGAAGASRLFRSSQ